MNAPSLSAQLRCELVRRRLPRFYVHRVMREFDDHSQDIVAEHQAMPDVDRLGDPRQLAKHFATEFRARHFAGRHPWLVFLLGPIPCTILLVALVFTLGFWSLELLGSFQTNGATSWSMQYLAIIVCQAGMIVPLMTVTYAFGRWAFRSGCGARWFWAVAILECALGALMHSQLKLPTAPGSGALSIGLSYPPAMNWELVALPALVAVGLAWHVSRRGDTAPLAAD
jgi:hypothetical protein